jgi:hypothetical protein
VFLILWIIAFAVLFVSDFYNLKREGVHELGFPWGEVAIIVLIAIVGVPYVLIKRRGWVKEYTAKGGKPSGWHIFFNISYGVFILVGLPAVLCCWWYSRGLT